MQTSMPRLCRCLMQIQNTCTKPYHIAPTLVRSFIHSFIWSFIYVERNRQAWNWASYMRRGGGNRSADNLETLKTKQNKTKGIMGGVGKYNDMVGCLLTARPSPKGCMAPPKNDFMYSHSVHVGFVYGSQPIPTHAPFPTLPLQGMLRHKCLRSSAWAKGLQKFIAFSQTNVDLGMDTGLDIRADERGPRAMRHGHEYGCMLG